MERAWPLALLEARDEGFGAQRGCRFPGAEVMDRQIEQGRRETAGLLRDDEQYNVLLFDIHD